VCKYLRHQHNGPAQQELTLLNILLSQVAVAVVLVNTKVAVAVAVVLLVVRYQ